MTAITVQFTNNNQPVVPDLGSAIYNLYGQDGGLLLTNEPITVPVATTQATVEIADQYEVRTLKYEKRTVIFSWRSNTILYTKRYNYRLSAFLNYSIGIDHVRSYLGLSDSELKDEWLDLVGAYIDIENIVGETALDNAFAAGGATEQLANKALLYAACLQVIPSLRLRLAKESSDGPLTWKRFDVKDFNELQTNLEGLLDEALNTINVQPALTYTLITVSNPTDIITGA